MKGFREFLMRGNLIELAVAVIIGSAFAAVVKAFTDMLLEFLALFGQVEGLENIKIGGLSVGMFLSALLTFVITATVVYFFIVSPYNRFSEQRKKEAPEVAASSEDLLAEIRDLLRDRQP
jgi:large conductance mechanosensitive channel